MPTWSQVMIDARTLLADDVRHAWKWLSVQLGVVLGLLALAYGYTDWMQDLVPAKVYAGINGVIAFANVYNALRKKN